MLYETAQLKLRKITEEAAHRNASWDQVVRYRSTVALQDNLLKSTQSVTTKRWHELLRHLLMRGAQQYAGWRERALYTAVAALQAHVLAGIQTARNALLKLTATYRVWRQLLEDKMHKMVLRWRTTQACSTSKHQSKWWVMAAMWKRQLGSPRTRALREWSANTRKAATHTAMGTNMRHCATTGVRVFPDVIVLRRERAKEAITMAVGIRTPPAEHAAVIIPPHSTDGALSMAQWGQSPTRTYAQTRVWHVTDSWQLSESSRNRQPL